MRVPEKGRICATTKKLSEWVPKNGIISVSTEKWSNPGEYREKVEFGDYQEMVESVLVSKNCLGEYPKGVDKMWVQKNGRIRASTGKKVEFVRVSKNCPNDYRKMVESVWVPENGQIRVSTGKR